VPIRVRADGDRYVLVEGLHRLEACRSLGEETVMAVLAQARVR
jgi:ParB-like chromosome segregation protein Spo0J